MKRYVITGGTSGIGNALVESFYGQDVELILLVRDEEKAKNLYLGAQDAPPITFIKANMGDVPSLKEALTPILNLELDGFVHCAGVFDIQSLKRTTYNRFLKLMNVNLFSFAEILRLLVSAKPNDKRFRVVSMSSVDSFRGDKTNHMYCASKAAMDSFIRAISLELNPMNVEINTVQPSFVDTPMVDHLKLFHLDNFEEWIRTVQPLGAIPREEVVEMIRFFLDKKGTKVTGTSTFLNAGIV